MFAAKEGPAHPSPSVWTSFRSPLILGRATREVTRLTPLILSRVLRAASRHPVPLVRAAPRRAIGRREALARDELTAISETHVLRSVSGCHGSTGPPRSAVRASGVGSVPCICPVVDGSVSCADVVLYLHSFIGSILLRSAPGSSIPRRGIISLDGLLPAPDRIGSPPTDKITTPARLLSDELRLALSSAVRLLDAASRGAVGRRGALAGDELLAVAQPDVLGAGGAGRGRAVCLAL